MTKPNNLISENNELKDRPLGWIKIVDKNGSGDYKSIAEAVSECNHGDTILVMPGDYNESVHAFFKEVHIVGVCKKACILRYGTADYANPPLEMSAGSVSNMTIYADSSNSAAINEESRSAKPYAIHCESDFSSGKSLEIRDCDLISNWSAAIGIGLRPDFTIKIINCNLISNYSAVYIPSISTFGSLGALFFHDSATSLTGSNQNLIVDNCRIKSKSKYALAIRSIDTNPNVANVTFYNNIFWSEVSGKKDIFWNRNGAAFNGALVGKNIFLTKDSTGNNIEALNA